MDKENKRKILFILGGIVLLYLVSTGISFAVFKYLSASPKENQVISPLPTVDESGKERVVISGPATEVCPLNGALHAVAERDIWEKRRPLTVMIENHADARPHQWGLSRADIVYEAVAEGGITRFLAVFYCRAAAEDTRVGPVRSARVYYMDFASEYGADPLYVHAGGANGFKENRDTPIKARALEKIADLGWQLYNDLNYDSVGLPTFLRDNELYAQGIAWEHTLFSTTEKLWELAHKRGLDAVSKENIKWDSAFVPWKFKDDASEEGQTTNISFDFWANYNDYHVEWKYDAATNSYLRENGLAPHRDSNNGEQLKARVVIIQFAKEEGPLDHNKHMYYSLYGKGRAIVFQDGHALEANWTKKDRQSRTIFADSKGKEILFNRGQIWIELLPIGREVNY